MTNGLGGQNKQRGAKYLRDLAKRNTFVRAAIKRRKDQIERASWRIVKFDENGRHTDADPKVLKKVNSLLRYVNPSGESFNSLLGKLVEDLLVIDAGCMEKERNKGGEVCHLWAVDGATIRINEKWIMEGCDPNAPRYEEVVDFQVKSKLRNDALIYMMQNETTYSPYGFSQVETLVAAVEAELYTESYQSEQLKRMAPAGLLDLGAGATPEQVDAFRAFWEDQIAGTGEAMAILGGTTNARYQSFNGTNKDAELMAYNEWLARKVAAVFSIDPMIFGLTGDVNKANGTVLQAQSDEGHVALANLIARFLTRELVWEIDENHCFIFTDVTQRDALQQAQIDQINMMIGATFPNELRKRDGKPPVDWGDEPYGPNGPIPDGSQVGAPNPNNEAGSTKGFFARRRSPVDKARTPPENTHYLSD